MAQIKDKKDSYFALALEQAEEVTIGVNGKIVLQFLVPYDVELRGYLKRDSQPLHYK
jgi:hypothetical protein